MEAVIGVLILLAFLLPIVTIAFVLFIEWPYKLLRSSYEFLKDIYDQIRPRRRIPFTEFPDCPEPARGPGPAGEAKPEEDPRTAGYREW